MSGKTEGKGENSNLEKVENLDWPPSPKRIKLSDNVNDIKKLSKEALLSKFQEQDKYINRLEEKFQQTSNAGELTSLRESEEKLKFQQQESTRRENVLVMRLATKEQEMQELLTQIHDLKQAQNPAGAQLRSTLLDPAVNIVFQRMRFELDETKEKLEQAQNDLSAWKFTPDSVTGKKLMAKCRMLIQENQELGRQLSQGRVAQLEAELALQKKYSEELKTSQDELNDFVIQLDEEVEGMQSTILTLQQQLKSVKTELLEERQQGEKQIEEIRILERNLNVARTQPPNPLQKHIVDDIHGDADRTDKSPESGPEEMEAEGSHEEPGEESEDKDMELAVHNAEYGNVKENVASVSSEEAGNMQLEVTDAIINVNNVSPVIGNASSEIESEKYETKHVLPVVENVSSARKNVRCVEEKVNLGIENAISNTENALSHKEKANSNSEMEDSNRKSANFNTGNVLFHTKNANPSMENANSGAEETSPNMEYACRNTADAKIFTENTKSQAEEAPAELVPTVSPFGAALEPSVRKSTGTPPCSTTFSISHLLGEPKRTPSPIDDISPQGGDAVVTKIPYIGGYTDPGERTEGLLNGEGNDATHPVVT